MKNDANSYKIIIISEPHLRMSPMLNFSWKEFKSVTSLHNRKNRNRFNSILKFYPSLQNRDLKAYSVEFIAILRYRFSTKQIVT